MNKKRYAIESFCIFDSHLYTIKTSDNNTIVKLSYKESELLNIFCEHPQKTLSRVDIQNMLWGVDSINSDMNLNRGVYLLRKKLSEVLPDNESIIETVPRVGYIFTCNVELIFEADENNERSCNNEKKQLVFSDDEKHHISPTSSLSTTVDSSLIGESHHENYIKNRRTSNAKSVKKRNRYLILCCFFISLILLFFYKITSLKYDDTIQYDTIKVSDNTRVYIMDGVRFDRNANFLEYLSKRMEKYNIKDLMLGRRGVSLYREKDGRKSVITVYLKKYDPLSRLKYVFNDERLNGIINILDQQVQEEGVCDSYIYPYGIIHPSNYAKATVKSVELPSILNKTAYVSNTDFFDRNNHKLSSVSFQGQLERLSENELRISTSSFFFEPELILRNNQHESKELNESLMSIIIDSQNTLVRKYMKIEKDIFITDGYGGSILCGLD